MSCFKLPESLCDEMMGMIRNFLWAQKKEERNIAWLSWQKMCEPKCDGGLGFKKDRKSTRLNSSHGIGSRMPSSA